MAREANMTRWMRLVLVLSLGLNLAVLGVVVGMVLRGGEHRPPRALDLSLGPITRALAPEDRRAVNMAVRQGPGQRSSRQGRAAERAALLAALRAEAFVPEALLALLSAQRGRADQWAQSGHEAFVARVAQMPYEARLELAERLEAELRRPPKRR